jgi:hypothetical protein
VALTNRQIERYSRQLIVKDFGAAAQERLLASRVLVIADHTGAPPALAYLVGAGVGHLDLPAQLDTPARDTLIARLHDLNPDSTVRVVAESAGFADFDLALVLVDNHASLHQARALFDRPATPADNFAIVFARLDHPARIAVFPRRPPCPRCAGAGALLGPLDARSDNAGFVASLAALEAIKLLARFAPAPTPMLIEFRGYESSARVIDSTPGSICSCAG